MTKVLVAKNSNQQLLDYAVENIKEWHESYYYLRSDESLYPLFYTECNDWKVDKSSTQSYWTIYSGLI